MKQLIITSASKEDLINELSELIDSKISILQGSTNTHLVSRLDLAKGNWSGGFKMTPPTQDKYRRQGSLKPVLVGKRIFYKENDLLNFNSK